MNIDEMKAQKDALEKKIAEASAANDPKRVEALQLALTEQKKLSDAEKAMEAQREKVEQALRDLHAIGGKGPYDLGDGVSGGYTLRTFVNGTLGFSRAVRGPRKPKPNQASDVETTASNEDTNDE
jgi:hypothetical protein